MANTTDSPQRTRGSIPNTLSSIPSVDENQTDQDATCTTSGNHTTGNNNNNNNNNTITNINNSITNTSTTITNRDNIDSSLSVKLNLAEHIRKFLAHEAQYSDSLSLASKELLSTASSLVEQAYKLSDRQEEDNTSPQNYNLLHQLHLLLTQQDDSFSNNNPQSSGIMGNNNPTCSTSNPHQISKQHTPNQQQNIIDEQSKQNTSVKQHSDGAKKRWTKRHSHLPISQLPTTTRKKLSHFIPRSHHPHTTSIDGVTSAHQKNFKQRLVSLINKFRTDGNEFNNEEQYREALERELIKVAAGRGSKAIEELLEEDIDVHEPSGSGIEGWDNISEKSIPKPSLRPFFSSTTLDKI